MPSSAEVEIKFHIKDLKTLTQTLKDSGFRVLTPRTHEINTLYDTPAGKLRSRGEILRIRKYGNTWKITHKARGSTGKHKTRHETETQVDDGQALASIFNALGLVPSFRYEKFRTEWSDGKGHIVLDETPIGNIAEIEGEPAWIDAVARKLGVDESHYITQSYAQMFFDWKKRNGSPAQEMTWQAIDSAGR